jgi:cytochrome c peroxidase
VAGQADDTISVVEAATGRSLRTIPLGPRPELSLADRGEALFHDSRLSLDGWMSCQSCHTDGHSNGQLGDTLGDGSYGAPKRVPSLLGVGSTGPWTWTGSIPRLEDQIQKSVERTMRGTPLSGEQVDALAAYLRSLSPPRRRIGTDPAAEARGRLVFEKQQCARCHRPPTYTSPGRHDVDLVDEAGNRRFNPPSLRGLVNRDPLLHDGRAETIEAVFLEHDHPGGQPMSAAEVADLAAFLRSL